MIISIFTPHGGCPERCRFCDQKTSGGTPVSISQIEREIEKHLSTQPKADAIAFYGGTFTALSKERQLNCLNAALPYLKKKSIGSVRISTRPDAIEQEWLSFLKNNYALDTVELGVQSFDEDVLKKLGRTHSVESVYQSSQIVKKLGLKLGLHFLIGSPGEKPGNDARCLEAIFKIRPDFVRLHPLLVLEGTEIESDYKTKLFTPPDTETMIARLAAMVEPLENEGISVQRIGLQTNELLGNRVLAGAYHPALGDLVRSRVWRNRCERAIEAEMPQFQLEEICLTNRIYGTFIGSQRSQISYLKSRFKLPEIKVSMLKGDSYERHSKPALQMRFFNIDRPSERRKIELDELAGRRNVGNRHSESTDHS